MRHLLYFDLHMSEVPDENGARLLLERSKKGISREERVAFGFIAACGVGAIIFGGLHFWSNVKKPFLISYTGPRYVTSSEKESEQVALQRLADTDEDGVSDYDELRIFFTSPYIADSDSDGRNDGMEIAEGGDPNCALGKTCVTQETIQARESTIFSEAQPPEQGGADLDTPNVEEVIGKLEQLSVEEVRALLAQSGVDQEALASLSDEQVMQVYAEALKDAQQELAQEEQGQEQGATP